MTFGRGDFERTIAFAELALEKIRTYRTAAHARSYELWYTYVSGQNPTLNKAIDAIIARDRSISDEDLEQIYDAYLSPLRFGDRIDKVGIRLAGEIEQIMDMVEAAMGQTTTYGAELRSAHTRLATPNVDIASFHSVVEGLVRMTREMEISNKILEERLTESRTEIQSLQADLNAARTESLTDPLTSLSNRKAFDAALNSSIGAVSVSSSPLSLLITDIDHFKRFNDSYGHLTGDQVLRLVAMAVKQNIKGADIAARYGGEEFAVILPETPLRAALTVAEHIRRAVMAKELVKRSTGETLGRITISVGVASFRAGDTAASLIERADACLYAAKRGGRNRVISETDPELVSPQVA